jgi:hypothetical protein
MHVFSNNYRILMIIWFTGINYYKLAVEKDRDSIFTTINTTIWKQVACEQAL